LTKLRVEVVLTDADADIIEYLTKHDIPRATQFKNAIREKMQRREEEQFDERVKRLLGEVIAEKGYITPQITKVESKKRLGFNARKG